MEDKILIKYIKKRKEEGLRLLIEKYGGLIKAVIKRYLYNLSQYEDECMNDILLSIWDNIKKFDSDKGDFKNWIIAISKYKAIDYKRKYLKDLAEEGLNENLMDKNKDVDEDIIRGELVNELEELLSSLNDMDRKILKKIYFEDMKVNEVSNEMNLKKSYIYNRVSRAKSKLRTLVGIHGEV